MISVYFSDLAEMQGVRPRAVQSSPLRRPPRRPVPGSDRGGRPRWRLPSRLEAYLTMLKASDGPSLQDRARKLSGRLSGIQLRLAAARRREALRQGKGRNLRDGSPRAPHNAHQQPRHRKPSSPWSPPGEGWGRPPSPNHAMLSRGIPGGFPLAHSPTSHLGPTSLFACSPSPVPARHGGRAIRDFKLPSGRCEIAPAKSGADRCETAPVGLYVLRSFRLHRGARCRRAPPRLRTLACAGQARCGPCDPKTGGGGVSRT